MNASLCSRNYLNYLTEEMKNPTRTLPIAIIISLVFITIIYLLANIAYLSVLTPEEMVAVDSVVAIVSVFFVNCCRQPAKPLLSYRPTLFFFA